MGSNRLKVAVFFSLKFFKEKVMKLNLKKLSMAAGLAGMMMVPVFAHADSVNLNINLGADDEAHFHFADQSRPHHPEIWKAAQALQNAKHRIWEARKHTNFGGHAENSIQAINLALDELRMAEDYARSHR
jgi:hypothetical protein